MRVFSVRPSDNGNYGIEEALGRLLEQPARVDQALFRGLRSPLQPLNYDPAERGLAALNRYDLVVLAGVDPMVFSSRDHLALLAFVERGGALLLLGGSHSFGSAQGTYFPLAPLLPVQVLRGLDVEVNALPRGTGHPIARGLPEPLGYISKVHPVEVAPGAEVALVAGDFPLVVTGEWGYGRVVVVASYPECHEAEYGWFFTGDAFDDFLREAVAWMTKRQPAVWFEGFSLPSRQVGTGSESFGKALLGAAEPSAVQLTTTLAHDGRVVDENTTRLHVEATHEALFSFRAPRGPDAGGVHYVTVTAAAEDGRPLARRDVAIEVANPTRAIIEFQRGRRCALPGESVRLRVQAFSERRAAPPEVSLDLAVLDTDGTRVHEGGRQTLGWKGSTYEDADYDLELPILRAGTYRVRAELSVRGKLADAAEEELHVLPLPPSRETFPLIAEGAAHLDRGSIERALAVLADAGVNTLSLPGPPTTPWGERPHREAMLAYAEQQAARAGLSIAHHRCDLVPGLQPTAPLGPCALSAGFRRALRDRARPVLQSERQAPGILLVEMVPRTAVLPEQLCRCPACREAYRRNFQGDLPSPAERASLSRDARHALHSFLSSYWWAVYAMVRKLRDRMAPHVRLAIPSSAASFLRERADGPYTDIYSWARAADVVEVAPEPNAARYRFSLAAHRGICQAEGKALGAALDLANRALPPAQAAFTALAQGAEGLRVAENPRFALRADQPPLEEALGGLFRRLQRAAPLLALAKRAPARLALVFPFTQMVDDGTADLLPAHELLCDAFGDVDVLHQRRLTDDGLSGYQAVAILGTRMLRRKIRDVLIRFVERGGLLLADSPGLVDQDGAALPWPEGFWGGEVQPVCGAVTLRSDTWGEGRTVLFSPGVAERYDRARADDERDAARALCQAVAAALISHGVEPRVGGTDAGVEVGLRVCPGVQLLVVVNHTSRGVKACPRVRLGPFEHAFDLLDPSPCEVRGEADVRGIDVRVRARGGGIWALFPDRPQAIRIAEPEPTGQERSGPRGLRVRVTLTDADGSRVAGSYPLRVLVLDPGGVERPAYGGGFVAWSGALDLLLPIATNDPAGAWRLCVTEPLTGLCAHATFQVGAEPPPPESETEPHASSRDEEQHDGAP